MGSWEQLEESVLAQYKGRSLASLWYYHKPPVTLENCIISFSCSIARILHERFNINSGLCLPSCLIWNNPALMSGRGTLNSKQLMTYGINTIGQIYDGKILPYELIKERFGLSDTFFLTYAQLSSILKKKVH